MPDPLEEAEDVELRLDLEVVEDVSSGNSVTRNSMSPARLRNSSGSAGEGGPRDRLDVVERRRHAVLRIGRVHGGGHFAAAGVPVKRLFINVALR